MLITVLRQNPPRPGDKINYAAAIWMVS